ncbi:MAG: dihydroorotate dehydrogenase [Gemmatimonadetes bacterium]|nr:dihydroorotate dehydrogenase [Gemmatimonadota bacterium]
MVDLGQTVLGVEFQNPILLASGCCGYGEEYAGLIALDELGGLVTKAVTREPRIGNPPPRVSETPAGMINAIGLANVGLERFRREKLPWLRENLRRAYVLVNVAGWTVEDFVHVVRGLDDAEGFLAYELDASCPNVERGAEFATDEALLGQLVRSVRAATQRPIVVKLSPQVPDIGRFAEICETEGADGVSTINTFPGLLIDVERRRPIIGNVTGGISGPAIRPMGVYATWCAARRVRIPVIGIGGISGAADALEYMLAGAPLVQIGTALFVDPEVVCQTLEGLRAYGERHGVHRLADLVGALEA